MTLEPLNFQSISHRWKIKFLELGWRQDAPSSIIDFLNNESMPLAPQEFVILSSEISPISTIKSVSYRPNFFYDGVWGNANAFYQVRPEGGLTITVKRMIVYSFTKGWVLLFPFASLQKLSIETDSESNTFQLEFDHEFRVWLSKRTPSAGPKNPENAYFDKSLQEVKKITLEENRTWIAFFAEIIKNKNLIFDERDFQIANRLKSHKYLFKKVPKVKQY